MSTDPTVIAAMAAAVASDSENLALRLHLAGLLQGAQRSEEALSHVAEILRRQPDHVEALSLGAQAAAAAGQAELAARYARLATALGAAPAEVPPLAPAPMNLDAPPIRGFEEVERVRLREGGEEATTIDAESSNLRLSDVAGLAEVKERLELAFLGPLRNPELRKMYGKSLRGGLLLYGPPGCGKTFLARAIAGEMGMQFVTIGLNDVLNMYLGESERQLHEIFEAARRIRPCVMFLDEVDALGRKRSLQRQGAGSTVVNQLLQELDGVVTDNEGLYVLAATNHPWDVDAALRRPGRLDRTLFVPPPDAPARRAILATNLADRPRGSIDLDGLAKMMEGFSGADVAHAVESAAEQAMAKAIRSGEMRPIDQDDFKRALKDITPSTRVWFETAKNYALFANDGGSYDALLEFMRARKML